MSELIPNGLLSTEIVDRAAYDRAVERFQQAEILLPTFSQLADPTTIPAAVTAELADVGPDDAHPLNLFRVNWYNAADRVSRVPVPGHLVIPPELSGVEAPIVLLLGDRFPMITAHKVLAAYACLAPRLVTGTFDPTRHRAVWPSTGNYARGGIAISRIMRCRGVAVLPEGMSAERFDWLDRWVDDPADIIRTPGSESNVKEIYDACAELAASPTNVVLNQFSEYANHLAHVSVTGPAMAHVYETFAADRPGTRLAAFVSATGSAGTIGAGDHLKDRYGSDTVAVEALECPTLLYNGFGEHNIQGIGDKHIPLIHNMMNTDVVTAVSDRATDELDLVFNSPEGQALLASRGVAPAVLSELRHLGFSSIANLVAAIKYAKHFSLGADDVVMTVATDGSAMYDSERAGLLQRRFGGSVGAADVAEMVGRNLDAITDDHLLDCTSIDRNRIFNLGYFTWVEQQGTDVGHFEARRDQAFWKGMRAMVPAWDEKIAEFNERTGLAR